MKIVSLATLALLGSLPTAHGTVTLNFGALELRTAMGIDLAPKDSLVVITASPDLFFASPTPTSFFSGNDILIGTGAVDPDGELTLAVSGNWNPGDSLQMYWFPSVTTTALAPGEVPGEGPGEGTQYGQFRADVSVDGSEPWIIPADGNTATIFFLTESAGGSTPNEAGYASLTVAAVPEPAQIGQIAALLVLSAGVWRRLSLTRRSRGTLTQ